MSRKLKGLLRHYQAALRRHLVQGPRVGLPQAEGLGHAALTLGLETLDLARIHERAVIALVLPGGSPRARATKARQAGRFFAEAVAPIEQTHRSAREANASLNRMIETLNQRSVALIAANQQLHGEIRQRKSVETSLRQSERHYSRLLKQSHLMQERMRRLSRQLLLAQEEERKLISRELHDEIAQTLTGINIRLAALKTEAMTSHTGLRQKIASTQRLVQKSVEIVHRFARELRPAVLDDLGLIPALHSFLKSFTVRTGVRTRLTTYAGVEQLDTIRRTVLFRVAQEALTNVARHAHASRVKVRIQKLPDHVCMCIEDDGRSFDVERTLRAHGGKHLGLLGMRERLQMVGGSLALTSVSGKGTTVEARIPLRRIVEVYRKPSPRKLGQL